jgi:hypothetical protein
MSARGGRQQSIKKKTSVAAGISLQKLRVLGCKEKQLQSEMGFCGTLTKGWTMPGS